MVAGHDKGTVDGVYVYVAGVAHIDSDTNKAVNKHTGVRIANEDVAATLTYRNICIVVKENMMTAQVLLVKVTAAEIQRRIVVLYTEVLTSHKLVQQLVDARVITPRFCPLLTKWRRLRQSQLT